MSVRARQTGARALAGAASLLLVLALVAGYARHAAFDSDQFSNRATAALRDDSVRALLAKRITDDVVLEKQADLITARPIIESVASGVVGSSAFTGLFRAAVRDVHRAVFDRDRDTVTLAVADVGTLLGTALQQLRPWGSPGPASHRRRTGRCCRRGRRCPGRRLFRRALTGPRFARGAAGPGGGGRGLGRVPRRPEDGNPDRCGLRRCARCGGGINADAGRPGPAAPTGGCMDHDGP